MSSFGITKKKQIKLNKEKRSNVFRLRLTQLEREQWEAMAEEVGLGNNLSKFVRPGKYQTETSKSV